MLVQGSPTTLLLEADSPESKATWALTLRYYLHHWATLRGAGRR